MNARDFLDSLKKEFNVSYDKELADLLGSSKEALDKWVVRNKIPDRIMNQIGHNVIGNDNISISGSNNYVNKPLKNFDNDIREWKSFGNTFTYIFHDDDIEHTIEFYSHNKPKYICYKIEKFCSFYGIEYRNYKI